MNEQDKQAAEEMRLHRATHFQSELAALLRECRKELSWSDVMADIQCGKCQASYQTRKLVLQDHHYYVRPSGCTEGDYWLHNEYAFICPSCKVRNRFLGGKRRLKTTSFAEVKDVYNHDEAGPFINLEVTVI